jgi:hypothetical protein
MPTHQDLATAALVGIGATAVMDAWLLVLARMGLAPLNFHLIGRWIGHMPAGRFTHVSIAKSPRVRAELALGLLTHYVTGVAYAAGLVAIVGASWTKQPTVFPALAFGVATVVAPFFVMQPAMGSGFAASKTPTPLKNRLRSIANHCVFGAGLYFAAAGLAQLSS